MLCRRLGERKHVRPWSCPTLDPTRYNNNLTANCTHWNSSGTEVMEVTSHSLLEFETCPIGGISCLVLKPIQKPRSREIMVSRGRGILTGVSLHGHVSNCLFTIYVYTHTFVLLST